MKKVLLIAIALMVISVPAFALVNGGFESGDLTGWTSWASPWGGTYTIEVQDQVVKDGAFALHLGSTNKSFGVAQAFTTVPGQPYTLSGFWNAPKGTLNWVEVLFFNDDGRPLYDQCDSPANSSIILKVDGWGMNGGQTNGWESFDAGLRWFPSGPMSLTKVATGNTMYVVLKSGASSGSVNSYFDAVNISTVPEPGSMLALFAGLAGFGGMIIRRKH